MDSLRKFLFLKRIYFQPTIGGSLYTYLYVGIALLGVVLFAKSHHRPELYFLSVSTTLYFLLRTCARFVIVQDRLRTLVEVPDTFKIGTEIGDSAMSYELDRADDIRLFRGEANAWEMYVAVFKFYTKTKYGRFLSKRTFYTVFEAELKPTVPHLIFDSRASKGRQYKRLYLQSQKLTLEGNFNRYFDVYSPQHYQIDTLSFITPDVMEALVALKDFDIELVDDRLLCSGPLLNDAQVDYLQLAATKLVKELEDNLAVYRDNRLNAAQRKTGVTPFGQSLLKNPMRSVPVLVLSGIAIAGMVFFYVSTKARVIVYNQLSIFVYILFVSSLFDIVKTLFTNRRLEAKYRRLYGD